jgi:NADH:ubiquinone oxidoreductase subunit D
MSRSVGLKRDLRLSKLETYSNYYFLNFRSFLGQHGDSYDRFLIRMNEMAESLNIINQVIYKIIKHKKFSNSNKNNNKYTNISPHNIIKYTNPTY